MNENFSLLLSMRRWHGGHFYFSLVLFTAQDLKLIDGTIKTLRLIARIEVNVQFYS